MSTKPNEQHMPQSPVVTLREEQNTLISLSPRTCTSANVLFKFKPETTAQSLKWHADKPRAELRIPPAASFRSAVRRHEGQVVHNVRSGCLLPSSLWQYIKYVKSFGPTSLWSANTGAGREEAIITLSRRSSKAAAPWAAG